MDKWSKTGKPLLSVMADPGRVTAHYPCNLLITHLDRVFFQGLRLFPHIRIYANAYVFFIISYLFDPDPFFT